MAWTANSLWKLALKARRKHHARFEKAEREGRLEEECRLYNAELRKKYGGIFEFEPVPPPYPGTLRIVTSRPRNGTRTPSPKKRKKNPE